jgi:hypothetical protein
MKVFGEVARMEGEAIEAHFNMIHGNPAGGP